MDDALYREEILDHYYGSPYRGRLEAPDYQAALDNPLCGDHVQLNLGVDDQGRIDQFRFDGHGCAISQAAASILAAPLEGHPLTEAEQVNADRMINWLGISLTPARRKCGLLALRALHQALADAEPNDPADPASNSS